MSISLKKILFAGTALVAMNYATQAHAACDPNGAPGTVVIGNGECVQIDTDPAAKTAISFTGAEGGEADVNGGIDVTGKVITAFDGIGELDTSGTSTFSGNIGAAGLSLQKMILDGGVDDVATFNGNVFAWDIFLSGTGAATFNKNVTVSSGDTITFQDDGTANFNGNMVTGPVNFNNNPFAVVNFGDNANMTGDIFDGSDNGGGNVNFAGNSKIDGGIGFDGGSGDQINRINVNGAAGTTVEITGNVNVDSGIEIQDTGALKVDGNNNTGNLDFNDDGSVNWNYDGTEGFWNGDAASDGGGVNSGFGSLTFTGNNENLNVFDGDIGNGGDGILHSFTLAGNSNTVWVNDFHAADVNNLNTNTLQVNHDFFLGDGQTIQAAISNGNVGHAIGNEADDEYATTVESGAIVQVRVASSNTDYINEGDQFTIVDGSIDTSFSDVGEVNVQDTAILDFEQVADANNLIVEVANRNPISGLIGGENGRIGDVVDGACNDGCDGPLSGLEDQLLNAADDKELNDILDRAKPDVTGATQGGGIDAQNKLIDKTEDQLAALRSGETMSSGMAAGAAANGASMWLQGYGQTAQQDFRKGVDGYDSNTFGGAIGVDSSNVIDGAIMGLAFNYAQTAIDSNNANTTNTDLKSYGATLYGSHDFGQQMFVNAQIGYAYNKIDSTRHNAGGPGLFANGDYNSNQYAAKVRVGNDYAAGSSLTLTPSASAAYTYLKTDGYTETGTGALLAVNDDSFNSLKLGVDVKAEWNLKNDKGGQLKPSIHAGYDYDTIGDNIEATASFVGGGGSFNTTGADPARSSGTAGAAFTYTTPANWDLTAKYDYNFKSNYDSHSGLIRATAHF